MCVSMLFLIISFPDLTGIVDIIFLRPYWRKNMKILSKFNSIRIYSYRNYNQAKIRGRSLFPSDLPSDVVAKQVEYWRIYSQPFRGWPDKASTQGLFWKYWPQISMKSI